MADTITLRAYLHDLNKLVDNESPTEVISHCRYILQHFPQNVATYRLLGKALLQKGHNEGLPEHFVQAADIFQRVLSVVPDDPVAHLALSEIREQDGAVEQAIWHMERAQEKLPGNALIREALRKLYTRRTGLEGGGTDKLQLSQGALARQYASSQLYDEAIMELRQALHAEPERVDLQMLLAKLLWESQHRVEAGEVAVEVLERLPYCLDANILMAQLWLAYGRPSDAQQFLDRVEALDPYAAGAVLQPGQDKPDPNVLPRLDYTARAAANLSAETPEWVHDLDEIDEYGSGFGTPGGGAQSVDRIDTAAVFGDQAADAPPDWAQDFGASGEEAVPDWFAAPAPQQEHVEAEAEPAIPSWLDDEAPEADLPEAAPHDLAGAEPDVEPGEVPDWFQMVTGAQDEAAHDEDAGAALPDWDSGAPADQWTTEAPGDDELLDALAGGEFSAERDDTGAITDEAPATPDWFSDLGNAASVDGPTTEGEAIDPLAWLNEEPEAEAGQPDDSAPDEEAAVDWLPYSAEDDQPRTLEEWQQTIATGDEPGAQEAGGFLSDDDEIEDLDRLFDALNAAEAAGDELEAEAADTFADEFATPTADAAAPTDDWLAMFREEEADVEDVPEAESPAPEAALRQSDAPQWNAPLDAAPAQDEHVEPLVDAPESEAPSMDPSFDETRAAFDEQPSSPEPEQPGMSEMLASDIAEETDIFSPLAGAGAEMDDLLGDAALAADDDLLSALSAASEDDDWLQQLGAEASAPSSPALDSTADDALSEDDIMAIFGEMETAPPEQTPTEPPLTEQAFDLSELLSESADTDWSEAEPADTESARPGAFAATDMADEVDQDDAAPAWAVDESAPAESEVVEPAESEAPEGWVAELSDDEAAAPASEFAAEDDGELADSQLAERPGLFGLARAVEQAQQSEVPDWMTGLEIEDSDAAEADVGEPQDVAYDPFEGGDPANVPTYESAGHTGILQPDEEPDWMLAFSPEPGDADAVVSEEEEALPDFAAADLVDEAPEDAVAAFDAAAQTPDEPPSEPSPERSYDGVEWDMPGDDLILGVEPEPEPRAETEADIPDWLSAITQSASTEVDDLLPDEDDLFAAGDMQAAPDWLREIEEPASDEEWGGVPETPSVDDLAPIADLADTRDALPSEPEDEDEFDGSFSFTDREPTWLRRASQWREDGTERD